MLSANVHIPIVSGREKLRTIAALVTAGIVQCLYVIGHCVPSRGSLSTQEALELNQTLRSFNLLNTLIHPGQVAWNRHNLDFTELFEMAHSSDYFIIECAPCSALLFRLQPSNRCMPTMFKVNCPSTDCHKTYCSVGSHQKCSSL